MKYRVIFFSGSRAEFGLSENLIKLLSNSKKIKCDLIIGGSHCIEKYGNTKDIIIHKHNPKYVLKYDKNKISVTEIFNQSYLQISKILDKRKYNLSLIVGDRYELLALAYNCFLRNIPICHIHGGEKTVGSMDDTVRHVISKLANLHFVANKRFKKRLIQLGEIKKNIFIVGGLGIDSLSKLNLYSKYNLYKNLNIKLDSKIILVSLHPTTDNKKNFKYDLNQFFTFLKNIANNKKYYFVFSGTSSDINSNLIEPYILKFCRVNNNTIYKKNFGHTLYSSLISHANIVIGNSSSGVIDTAYYKTASINVGTRQNGRPLSSNTINADFTVKSLTRSFKIINSKLFEKNLSNTTSYYGKPGASKKIFNIIEKKIPDIESKKLFIDLNDK